MLSEILEREMEDMDTSDFESGVELLEVLASGCGAITKCGGCIKIN